MNEGSPILLRVTDDGGLAAVEFIVDAVLMQCEVRAFACFRTEEGNSGMRNRDWR